MESTGQHSAEPIRVFVSSPGDLRPERLLVAKVCKLLEKAIHHPIEPLLWEGGSPELPTIPAFRARITGHGAQAVIDDQCWNQLGGYDVYVGMMWYRMGTPTGDWRSGTEAEFQLAQEKQRSEGHPREILFYRNVADYPSKQVEPDQLKAADSFCEELSALGLVQQFAGPDQLETHLLDHLGDAVREVLGLRHRGSGTMDDSSQRWQGRPVSLGDDFFGRQTELSAITHAFSSDKRAVVLMGGAGEGKSQLAAEYAHQAAQPGFWTPAQADTAATIATLAGPLGIPTEGRQQDDVVGAVSARLHQIAGGLWAVDNLPGMEQVQALQQAAGERWQLLVTSRDSGQHILPPWAGAVSVPSLAGDDAVALLTSRWREGCGWERSDADLPKLATAVGGLPLALEQLAARLTAPLMTPGTLLDQVQAATSPVLLRAFQEAAATSIPHPEGVFGAIAGALATLSQDDRVAIASLGYLADAPLPLPLFLHLTATDQASAGELIERCQQQSLLRLTGDQVVVHSLTAATIAATNTDGPFRIIANHWQMRLVAINTSDPVALRAEVAHHERLLQDSERVLGPEHQDTLAYRNGLAEGYRLLGRTAEAAALDEETLRGNERVLGLEHRNTLASRRNLALDYCALGRTTEAVALGEEVLRASERVLGPEHQDTMISRNNLAISYRTAGRIGEALELDEETLRIRERVHGPDHPATLRSRGGLANAYRSLGRTAEAVALYEETLRIGERVLGPEHPDTLNSRHNLGVGYRELGRTAEAMALLVQTLAVRERVLGPEHPATLSTCNNLAVCYMDLGRTAEAVTLYEEALRVATRVLGSEHSETLSIRNNLAGAYRALGRTVEAVAMHEETLRVMERVLGSEHPSTLASRYNLAVGYQALGRTAEAVALDEVTLGVMERVLGPEHPDTLRSRNNLAIGYGALGRSAEAVALDEVTLAVRERVLGPEHPDTLTSRNNLAAGYRELGRTAEAVTLDEATLAVRERVLGPEHPNTLTSRNNLANGYRARGRHEDADRLEGK